MAFVFFANYSKTHPLLVTSIRASPSINRIFATAQTNTYKWLNFIILKQMRLLP